MNKEKMFEIEIAKAFGQELVDKLKRIPEETSNMSIRSFPELNVF